MVLDLEIKQKIKNSKRIIVKIGSNTLLNTNGEFNYNFANNIISQIYNLRKLEKEFLVVSSGAIGCGNAILNLNKSTDISLNQLAASVGQKALMSHYTNIFNNYDMISSQILVSYDDFRNNKRRLNLESQLVKSFQYNVIPIVNENDSVATEEISFGDNDGLSAKIGNLTNSDLLILLSNVEGVYKNINTKNRIDYIDNLDLFRDYISDFKSNFGSGGMLSKFMAAETFNNYTIVANGNENQVLNRIFNGDDIGTIFDLN